MSGLPVRCRAAAVLLAMTMLIACVVFSASPAPAQAVGEQPESGTYKRSYSATKERYFKTLKRCVRVSVLGKVRFDIEYVNRYQSVYKNRRIVKPSIRVETYPRCNFIGPQAYKPSYKMDITQAWASSSCSTSVGISVGLPWSVGVSGSQSCETAKLASRRTTYEGRAGTRTQHNSTTKVKFNDEPLTAWGVSPGTGNGIRPKLCFKVDADVVIHPTRKSGSDSYEARIKPCVKWW